MVRLTVTFLFFAIFLQSKHTTAKESSITEGYKNVR